MGIFGIRYCCQLQQVNKMSKTKKKIKLPRFESDEANIFFNLAINIDKIIKDLTNEQIKNNITLEDFIKLRKKIRRYTESANKIMINKILEVKRDIK